MKKVLIVGVLCVLAACGEVQSMEEIRKELYAQDYRLDGDPARNAAGANCMPMARYGAFAYQKCVAEMM